MNNNSLKYGFVILHYNAFEMTIQCVDNLLTMFGNKEIHIVLIDNASPNGSGITLQEKYKEHKKVTVILHDKNEGFARGNNIGFNYLKNNYDIEYMIVMNNDIFIQSLNFLEKIKEIHTEYNFDILAPDIIVPQSQRHQNPLGYQVPTAEHCRKGIKDMRRAIRQENIKYYKLKILHYCIYKWAKPIAKRLFPRLYNKITHNNTNQSTINQITIQNHYQPNIMEGIIPHGACLIYSHRFIQKRHYAFYPETFMYGEENILALQCNEEGYKIIYYPDKDLIVHHLCHISTNTIKKNYHQTSLFYWEQNSKSFNIYIKLFEEYAQKKKSKAKC